MTPSVLSRPHSLSVVSRTGLYSSSKNRKLHAKIKKMSQNSTPEILRHRLNYYLPPKGNTFIHSVSIAHATEGHRKKSHWDYRVRKRTINNDVQ